MSNSEDSLQPNLEVERAALLQLADEARRAHFATDAAALLAHDADPSVWVREGTISSMSKAELLSIFVEDMQGATYHEWDYTEPSIVHIANDASMAWVVSRVRVRRTKRLADGTSQEEQFVYSGVNFYEKRSGSWTRVANVSTFADGEETDAPE